MMVGEQCSTSAKSTEECHSLFLMKYGAKSMQTFQHACSVAFFQLFAKIYITFELTIIFTLNLVVLCQIISSTSSENLKKEHTFWAELLRFRKGDIFLL